MKYTSLVLPLLICAAPLAAAPLSERVHKVEVRHCVGDRICHTQSAAYPLSGHTALDRWAAEQLQQRIGVRSLRPAALKTALRAETGNDRSCNHSYINHVELLGQSAHYAVFGEEDWEYTCGAHGNGAYLLYVLPKSGSARALTLEQIVLPGKMAQLESLQLAAWRQDLATPSGLDPNGMSPAEIDAHLAQWPFEKTGNWRLDENGLVFLFQAYEIAPYVMGRPELFISREQLQGVVKPEILNATATFRPSRRLRR